MPSKDLRPSLAKTLDIRPDQILDYAPSGDGLYTVIMVNFMKFVKVKPAPEEPAEEPSATKKISRSKRTTTQKR